MSHGTYIFLLIVLLALLLVVWLLRRAMDRTASATETRAEDHDRHPRETVWEVPGEPHDLAEEEDLLAEPEPLPFAPQPLGPPDELTRLKGLGPRAQTRLNELGITRFDQLAAMSEADAERIDAEMGTFRGRIARDRWVEQARFLAAGDIPGFEAAFGKLG